MLTRLIPLAALALAACGPSDEPAPGGVSESEAAALNDAAAMLDANATLPESVGIENAGD